MRPDVINETASIETNVKTAAQNIGQQEIVRSSEHHTTEPDSKHFALLCLCTGFSFFDFSSPNSLKTAQQNLPGLVHDRRTLRVMTMVRARNIPPICQVKAAKTLFFLIALHCLAFHICLFFVRPFYVWHCTWLLA